ncbi:MULTISPECIES: hypothetical protein [Haloferax]|uniref:Uncharacterized protein n=2 Tax=Haloferax TaxID=2251 RepID=A0A6G1Z118_9EURY|nr:MULTISPECIES: hypothetical protein [Haloferax]KAB1187677.1 hypothetical protein Hfx1149_06375 [Haloferax sp. CBA1149]MRW80337.1 hypothetical protein [Haloferax marinisediminis]
MTHDNKLGLPDALDEAPSGLETLADTVFVATAAVVGILVATLLATVVAPVGPGIGLVALFVGWPLGFLAAALGLRAGIRAIVRSGLPALARDTVHRVRAPPRVVTDGGHPDEVPCNSH